MKGKTVLVPTDFSRNAEAALKYAIGLAKEFDFRLIILHSYRLLQTTVPTVDQSPFSIKNQWDKETWDKFRNLEKQFIKGSKIKYDFEVDVGFASDAILSFVDANEIDMIIMGVTGAGALNQVLGSTTLKIIDKITCPVIVVPSEIEYKGVRKVLFAYDNKKVKQLSKLNMLVDYVKGFNAKLEILSIGLKKDVNKENKKELDLYFGDIDHQFNSLEGDGITDQILKYIRKKPSDILVALKRDHTFMEKLFSPSITRQLIHHSELPILVLHE